CSMRIESAVTCLSWIPSDAVRGLPRVAFELGVGRYDEPPPDRIDDIEALHARGAFRFANQLRAWVEVENGKIVGHGHEGRSLISRTILRFGALIVAFQPTAFPDIRWVAAASDRLVRFIQTAGGRAGVPAPRRVRGRPYFMWERPNVWTTLSLTMRAQGPAIGKLEGASRFPRHWVYDSEGRLVAKSRRWTSRTGTGARSAGAARGGT